MILSLLVMSVILLVTIEILRINANTVSISVARAFIKFIIWLLYVLLITMILYGLYSIFCTIKAVI